jgi:cell division protease FtsH
MEEMDSPGQPTTVYDPKSSPPDLDNKKAKKLPKSEIAKKRKKLFEKGSDFKPIKREDIIGIDNILVEIDQIIHWLQNSKAYQKHDSRLEPGVIFEGTPGTGKTLVSRYVATASKALFINIRDFAHNGALYEDTDISDLFNRARKTYAKTKRPIVLFWDEFEGAAVTREEASPEQVATVSQLTAELDGIHGKNEGILLVGCTNYIYGIDEALKRPGRMGLQIEFHAPDRAGKQTILAHYLSKYKVEGEVDIETLSYFFDSHATAASIEEACVEAWRFAVHRTLINGKNKPKLAQADLMKVFLKRLVGPPTSFINLPKEDRLGVAIHECGHAIMACVYDIPLRLITIEPGKLSLGRVMTIEVREHISTHDDLLNLMRVYAGSLAAEKVCNLSPTTGTKGDIQQSNNFAVQLVDRLAYGETGLFNPSAVTEVRGWYNDQPVPSVSEEVIGASDDEVKRILGEIVAETTYTMKMIGEDKLRQIAQVVCDKNTMTGYDFKDELAKIIGDFARYRMPNAV